MRMKKYSLELTPKTVLFVCVADQARDFNFNRRLHELGAEGILRAVEGKYVRWLEQNDYLSKLDKWPMRMTANGTLWWTQTVGRPSTRFITSSL